MRAIRFDMLMMLRAAHRRDGASFLIDFRLDFDTRADAQGSGAMVAMRISPPFGRAAATTSLAAEAIRDERKMGADADAIAPLLPWAISMQRRDTISLTLELFAGRRAPSPVVLFDGLFDDERHNAFRRR